MTVQSNFPSIKPSLLLDFANVKALDPRITFTRSTTATYYDGVTTAKAEENLLTVSQEFENVAWTKGNTTVTANSVAAPDGTTTAETLAGSSATSNVKTITRAFSSSGVTGTFTASIFAKANTHSLLQITFFGGSSTSFANFDVTSGSGATGSSSGGTASIVDVGNGWYRCVFSSATLTADTAFAVCLIDTSAAARAANSTTTNDLYIWGAQLEQRSAVTAYTPTTTQPITNYIPVLQTAASGVARFDHNPTTGESLGLLVEEQRTNLMVRSEDFSTTWVNERSSEQTNVAVAPDGTLSVDKLVEDTTATNSHLVFQGVSGLASGSTLSFSVYAKAAERTSVRLQINDGSSLANAVLANYDLLTGTTSDVQSIGTFTGASATITPVGNGWFRCSISGVATGVTAVQGRLFLVSGGTVSYTGDGYSGLYIWGAQLEAGAFPTSYIATTSASVTRNADVASMTGTNFSSWFNNGEGAFVVNHSPYTTATGSTGFPAIIFASDGTANNSIGILNNTSASSRRYASVNVSGSTVVNLDTADATYAANANLFSAVAYKVNDFAFARNGNSLQTDNSGTIPTVNVLYISNRNGTAFSPQYIKRVAFYPQRISNAQLQALTS